MEDLANDQNTYKKVTKSPFKKIECELNSQQLELNREQNYNLLAAFHPLFEALLSITSLTTHFVLKLHVLANILSPLQNHNRYTVNNSTDFSKKLSGKIISDDEIKVSFEVVYNLLLYLLTKHNYEHIRNILTKDETFQQRTKLSIDDIYY